MAAVAVKMIAGHVSLDADPDTARSAKHTAWWNKLFVLSAFTSVQNGDDIEQVIAFFHEAGLNALESNTPMEYQAMDLTPENRIRTLKACEKHNIKFFITDHTRMTGSADPKEEELKALVNDYAKYPALGGYYVWDEPRAHFDAVKKSFDCLQAADPDRLPLVAMLPGYGPFRHPHEYPAFVRNFVNTVDPPILSFDYYAMRGGRGNYSVDQGVYQDLALWSSLSLQTGKPFWMYVTSCDWGAAPSREMLSIQVYTAIAYGAKGIQYFVAKSCTGRSPSFAEAPLNMDGTKSAFFDAFRNFNREINAIAPTLMKLRITEVMHTSPVPCDNQHFAPHLGIHAVPEQMIVSFHQTAEGQDYLLLVSKTPNLDRQIELTVEPGLTLVLLPGMSEKKSVDGKIGFSIEKGGGMLFEIKK